ncbi:hypothetical protein EUZ85_15755 [Hahella sp. KA22]|uniref:RHS repeat domain-containing protein n=1 Tax=Hahella sp. KA22 TaxID=1628392 RepID=UPI000FDEE8DC|nr:RHS repeat-associated core domain-containing protein [Hahella sp. KA22]AZZ92103.1 hypothetical protein ENC22_13190 [Hahella sp. KA22]QAY55473.1 hypothetical protein EUZ85_15755 [Hahella sp. KA22]
MRRKSMFKIASASMRHVLLQVATLFVTALLAVSASAQTLITYYHNDALGSPVAATDQDGNLLWRENYAPYGQKIDNPKEAYDTHIGYTGKPDEGKTGLTYMNARYYDPLVGRFMGVDPVSFLDKGRKYFQRYTYVDNNPYKYKDPNGEWYLAIGAVFGAAIEVGVAAYSGNINDFGDFAAHAAIGAVTGAAAAMGNTTLAAARWGAVAGITGSVGSQAYDYGPSNVDMAQATLAGAFGAAIGAVSKAIVSKFMPKSNYPAVPEAAAKVPPGKAQRVMEQPATNWVDKAEEAKKVAQASGVTAATTETTRQVDTEKEKEEKKEEKREYVFSISDD